ncbi:MAG: hypothetical protein ABI723_03925 [Bacteroidia bacterium]
MKTLKLIAQLCLCSIILCGYALRNKYPFAYSDTGAYLWSGFEGIYPHDRPIFYGLFLRHISLKASLFFVIFAQGLIVASMIYLFFKKFTTANKPMTITLITCIFLPLCSGISVNVGFLIPDVFTPVCFISLLLILFAKNTSKPELIYLSLIFVISSLMHLSHLLIDVLFLTLIAILYFIKKTNFRYVVQRPMLPVVLTICGLIIMPSTHYFYDRKFIYSEASHIFRLEKLIEMGIMEDFLQTHCEENKYSLCKYKDSDQLYWGFMWDEKSPANLDGGWTAHEKEYNEIANAILSESKYQLIFVRKTFENSFIQLFTYDVGDFSKVDAVTALNGIRLYFKSDVHEYFSTRQMNERLDFNVINLLQNILLSASIILIIMLFGSNIFTTDEKKFWVSLFISILLFIYLNSFVCSALTSINSRFQFRIIWVIPLFLFAILIDGYPVIKARMQNFLKGNS